MLGWERSLLLWKTGDHTALRGLCYVRVLHESVNTRDFTSGYFHLCRVEVDIAELAALELGKLAIRSPDAQGALR